MSRGSSVCLRSETCFIIPCVVTRKPFFSDFFRDFANVKEELWDAKLLLWYKWVEKYLLSARQNEDLHLDVYHLLSTQQTTEEDRNRFPNRILHRRENSSDFWWTAASPAEYMSCDTHKLCTIQTYVAPTFTVTSFPFQNWVKISLLFDLLKNDSSRQKNLNSNAQEKVIFKPQVCQKIKLHSPACLYDIRCCKLIGTTIFYGLLTSKQRVVYVFRIVMENENLLTCDINLKCLLAHQQWYNSPEKYCGFYYYYY